METFALWAFAIALILAGYVAGVADERRAQRERAKKLSGSTNLQGKEQSG